MTEMTGEFTYDSYLAHLIEREQRVRAEIEGFVTAKDLSSPGAYVIPELSDSYEVGFHLGKLYLKKDRHHESS
jgi:hypothetical protein